APTTIDRSSTSELPAPSAPVTDAATDPATDPATDRSPPPPRVRVALDLLGGDHAPDVVIDGALLAAADDPGVDIVIVGPPDVAANTGCSADQLAQFALAGAAYATVRLGLTTPRVGLLSNGSEQSKGDVVRREAYELLSALPVRFVGNLESGAVTAGDVADVV